MKLACIVPWFIRGLAAAAFMLVAVVVHAQQTSFTSTLSEENKSATGLTRLNETQLASLNTQIEREIAVAHQGDTPGFSTTFTHRRTPQQRKDSGLDQLMTPELKRLDELVATTVAAKPTSTTPTIIQPSATTSASPSEWVEITPRKMEVHGEVSLAYMWGSGGRSGFGASMATTLTDPSGKFSLTFAMSQFQFKGRGMHHPGEYECDQGW